MKIDDKRQKSYELKVHNYKTLTIYTVQKCKFNL